MKIEAVEQIAKNPSDYSGSERKEAWQWADNKRLDKRVSEDLRKRSENAFFSILNWALAQADKDTKYRSYDEKKSTKQS